MPFSLGKHHLFSNHAGLCLQFFFTDCNICKAILIPNQKRQVNIPCDFSAPGIRQGEALEGRRVVPREGQLCPFFTCSQMEQSRTCQQVQEGPVLELADLSMYMGTRQC